MGNLGERRLETGYLDGQTDPVLVKNGKAKMAGPSGDKFCKLKAFKVGLSAFVLA
jgi:hypothetical protein